MKFEFKKLTQKDALIIADEWKYENEYSFYDMTADEDDYDEFINEDLRENDNCFKAIYNNELVGYFSVGIKNQEIEIGLGLKPSYCGKGYGKDFLNQILDFIKQNYSYNLITLSIATVNKRAIKVYHSCGFIDKCKFMQKTNGGEYEFLKMILE